MKDNMEEFIVIIRLEVKGLVHDKVEKNKVFYTTTRENAEKIANESLDRFSSMKGVIIVSAKIYKAEQIGFANQV